MKIESNVEGFTLELYIPDNLIKDGVNAEEANKYINMAYKGFIDKILLFLAYAISSQDIDSIEDVAHILSNIAKAKLENE